MLPLPGRGLGRIESSGQLVVDSLWPVLSQKWDLLRSQSATSGQSDVGDGERAGDALGS